MMQSVLYTMGTALFSAAQLGSGEYTLTALIVRSRNRYTR